MSKSVLILCRAASDYEALATSLFEQGLEVVVAKGVGDAILRLKDKRFDLALVESVLDQNASGVTFLAEARKRLPWMKRVLLETTPLEISVNALVNEVAPSAIFSGKVDVQRLVDLLHPGPAGNASISAEETEQEGTARRQASEADKLDLLIDLSSGINSLVEAPGIVLPVLPEIALQVRKLMVDESYTFERVAELVELEQGMSARILQVSNSSIYAGLERIRNLQQAVARLGMRETRNILQAVIAQNLFKTGSKGLKRVLKDLWMHSICTAYSNENIARTLNLPNSEDYFMMGLLHDIGKLLILYLVEVGRQENVWSGRDITEDVVRRLMAMRHHDLGARLLQKWYYPASFQEVVRLHNDDANIHTRSEAVVVTYFSNQMTRKLGYSLMAYDGKALANRALASALNINDATALEMEASLRKITQRIEQSCFAEV